VRRLLVTAKFLPSSPNLVTLMMEALSSSETSVLTRVTPRNIPKYGILHSVVKTSKFITIIIIQGMYNMPVSGRSTSRLGSPQPHRGTSDKTNHWCGEDVVSMLLRNVTLHLQSYSVPQTSKLCVARTCVISHDGCLRGLCTVWL
jgi:hypothetical protein